MKRIGNSAYELELPTTLPMHPVFHTGLLKKWYVNTITQPPPTPVKVDGVLEYEVEAIVAHKKTGSNKRLQFLVKWAGHGSEHNTLAPANCWTVRL